MADDSTATSAKAEALIESLPWIARLQGKAVVVKFGGNAMVDESLKRAFAEDMVYLRQLGVRVVVVHGGGPQISAELTRRGIASEFRGGLRVTTPEALDVVREVLTLGVAHELAGLLNESSTPGTVAIAQPLSGETDGLFRAEKRGVIIDGEAVDLGQVGDVAEVNPSVVLALLDAGKIPVVSSIAPDRDDPAHSLNVNADSAASALAIALAAERLVILTDVAGLYRDWPNRDSLVDRITARELDALIPSLESGMIPKMTACLDAVRGGVGSAAVIDGRVPHSILLEAFSTTVLGTEVIDPDRSQPVKAEK
ncbi:acetylglutamate kinase [Parafrigoribacterium soli]|uniref:acetylglutamate kinase n=1 Tax=Parafrigoribacterium soli TaxID=3144663 RepID=UPI0032EBAC28